MCTYCLLIVTRISHLLKYMVYSISKAVFIIYYIAIQWLVLNCLENVYLKNIYTLKLNEHIYVQNKHSVGTTVIIPWNCSVK